MGEIRLLTVTERLMVLKFGLKPLKARVTEGGEDDFIKTGQITRTD